MGVAMAIPIAFRCVVHQYDQFGVYFYLSKQCVILGMSAIQISYRRGTSILQNLMLWHLIVRVSSYLFVHHYITYFEIKYHFNSITWAEAAAEVLSKLTMVIFLPAWVNANAEDS